MTDQLPSKEPVCGHCQRPIHPSDSRRHFGFYVAHADGRCVQLLQMEIERLRTTLRGISTCSTCEACRGAARLALGERTVEEINAAVDERLDRVERELAQPASRLCERCDSAIKNHECGCAKCGCTQCRLAQPPGDVRPEEC